MLYTVLCSLLLGEGVLAAELVEERLIGWRGETHHTNLCWGKRTQCYGVNVNTGRKANGYGSKDVASSFLYRYDKTGVNPTYAHMAMIEAFPNGTLMAIWQAGKDFEGTKDQHFMTSYSLDTDGADWSSPTRLDVIGGKGFALWGPVLFADAVGQKMWLFYSENTGTCKGGPMDWMPGGDIKAITYDLSTNVWAEEPMLLLPQDEDNGIPKVTANKPTELSTGEWLLPFWRERALVGKSAACEEEVQGAGSAGVLRSKDRGKTWEAHGYLTDGKTWLIENAVTEGAKGEALMVFRTQVGRIYQARSLDGGVEWGAAEPLENLPNPNSKVDLTRVEPGGELILVYNNHAKPRSKVKAGEAHYLDLVKHNCKRCRTFLTVAVSTDHGKHWKEVGSLESEVGETLRMHYPTLLQRGCDMLVAYSRFHKQTPPPDDPQFVEQGIKLARVHLCEKMF